MPAEAGKKTSGRRRWLTAYAPLVIWIIVILSLGSGMASMSETSRVIRPLLEFLFPSASPETLTFFHGIIRKLAHIFEYAVLAILALRAFSTSSRNYLFAFAVVMTVASTDEISQSFRPMRTGSAIDVLIDLVGGLAGLVIFRSVEWFFGKKPTVSTPLGPDGSVRE